MPAFHLQFAGMAGLTIKNCPDDLLQQLKKAAQASHRSLTQEALARLSSSLDLEEGDKETKKQAQRQADAWDRLPGSWESDLTSEEEINELFAQRTKGRRIRL